MLHPLDASAEPTTNWQRPRDSNFEAVETEADLTMSCLIFFPMYFQQLSMFFSEIQKSNLGIFSFLKFFRCRAQSYRYLSMRRYDRSSAAQKIRICILGGGGPKSILWKVDLHLKKPSPQLKGGAIECSGNVSKKVHLPLAK
jgi:hypothetical protein